MSLCRHSQPVPLSPDVKQKLEQVKYDLKLDPKMAQVIKGFTCLGFEPWSIGNAQARFGASALIGIPINFAYNNENDVDKNIQVRSEPNQQHDLNIHSRHFQQVGHKAVQWTAPDGLALKSSLVLSDAAKKFALAREVCTVKSHHLTLHVSKSFAIAYIAPSS